MRRQIKLSISIQIDVHDACILASFPGLRIAFVTCSVKLPAFLFLSSPNPTSLSIFPPPPPRGKCTVSLLNELEDVHTYLEKEDTFFYTMVYDPNQKTLLVDKGEIRIGPDYQAEIPPYILPGQLQAYSSQN